MIARPSRLFLPSFLVLTLLAAGCISPAAQTPAADVGAPGEVGTTMRDVVALAHAAGDNLSGRVVGGIEPVSFFIGHSGLEPTLGLTKEGAIFYAAGTFDNNFMGVDLPLPVTDILRSLDGGLTWEDVTPYLPGGVVRMHPDTGDPYVYVDVDTGRVFDIDQRLAVGCHTVTFSDDLGESWFPVDSKACLSPPADHHTLATAWPRVLEVSPLYPKVVHYCNNQIAASTCMRSLDGGITFHPGAPAFRGLEAEGLCGGLHGHIAPSPDGKVYLPKTHCGFPYVAVSDDDGTTWTAVKVADVPSYDDPTVAVDSAGNAHIVFLHGETFHVMLSSSTDGGMTWSEPVDVTAPGVTATNLPTMDAGDEGHLALVYVGTQHPDGHDIDRSDEAALDNMTWDYYMALVTNATAGANASITTVRLNPADDPIVRGPCGPGRCNNPGIVDFVDVVIDMDGRPWAALVDNCMESCAAPGGKAKDSTYDAGFVATLARGPALRGPLAELPPIHGAT